jgi:hypothetical protein
MPRLLLALLAAALAAAPRGAAAAEGLPNVGAPPQLSGVWRSNNSWGIANEQGFAFVYAAGTAAENQVLADASSPAAAAAAGVGYSCGGAAGAYEDLYDKLFLLPSGAPAAEPARQCEATAVNATAWTWAAGPEGAFGRPSAGDACPAAGAAAKAETRLPSGLPDLAAAACPAPRALAAPRLAAPAAAALAPDFAEPFPRFASPGGPAPGAGVYRSPADYRDEVAGSPPVAAAFIGMQSPAGQAYAGWHAGDGPGLGLKLDLLEYTSHECVGAAGWRATAVKRVLYWNGTATAKFVCEAGRFVAGAAGAGGAILIKQSSTACPPGDFVDAEASYRNELLEVLPALGLPTAACAGGAAPAAAAGRASAGAAVAAAAALLALW